MKATLLRFWCTCMCLLFCLAAQAAEPDELNKKEYETPTNTEESPLPIGTKQKWHSGL